MNTATILRLLTNSGFHNVSVDANFVYVEDPTCIMRSFEAFFDCVMYALAFITAFMLTGWAISIIRGAKTDNLFVNFRNLTLLFAALTLVRPAMDVVYGGDFFSIGCKTLSMPLSKVNELLELQKERLSEFNEFGIYEILRIDDSGAIDAPTQKGQAEQESINNNDAQSDESDEKTTKTEEKSNAGTGRQSSENNNKPTKATESGHSVIYHMPSGERIKHRAGTRAWRNTNPGNIRYSKFTRSMGAIGKAGGFSVFPDYDTGLETIEALLRTDSYNKLTIAGAISRYAPPSENNTTAYYNRLSKLTGLSINKKISELTPEEMKKVARAIQTIEGWRVGKVERM